MMGIRIANGIAALLVLVGCADNSVSPSTIASGGDATKLYWELRLNHHAINLSMATPSDTLQLVATPLDGAGNPITGLDAVTYSSSNPSLVTVSPDGLLHAVQPGPGIEIVANLIADGFHHADTAWVNISADAVPPMPAQLSIQPADSAVWPIEGDGAYLYLLPSGDFGTFSWKFVPATVTDAGGNPLGGLSIAYTSMDTNTAQVYGTGDMLAVVEPRKPGRVKIVAGATVYGLPLADTVEFTITMPTFGVVAIRRQVITLGGSADMTFSPADFTISPGGTAIWLNASGEPVDIVFDDASHVEAWQTISCAAGGVIDPGGAGNIDAFGVPVNLLTSLNVENCRSRRFPVAGVYPYHSVTSGATGKVVVDDGLSGSSGAVIRASRLRHATLHNQ